jgi:transcription elongation factor Elf1
MIYYVLNSFACNVCGHTLGVKRELKIPENITHIHLGCSKCITNTEVELVDHRDGIRWAGISNTNVGEDINFDLSYGV